MSFTNAYNETMSAEGGYVNDPTDRGGETYKGVSRKNWPNWAGWKRVDSYKPFKSASILYKDVELDLQIRLFYKTEFWDKPGFNKVDEIWEELAEKIFDTGVNVGTGRASKWLQSTMNLLNRDQQRYPDIKVDGDIGPNTIRTLKECLNNNPKSRILTVFAIHQGEHYKGIMEAHKTQEKYVGWFDRLSYK